MSVKGFKVGTAASEQYDYNYLDNKPNLSVYATKTEVAAVDDAALAAYATDTSTGAIASFSDGADGIPMKSVLCAINPVQSGSGDPAPDNVRPISGYTGLTVTRTGKNLLDNSALVHGGLNGNTGESGTSDQRIITDYMFLKAGTYIVSRTSSSIITRCVVCVYDLSENYLIDESYAVSWNALNYTFTLTADRLVRFAFAMATNETIDLDAAKGTLQLEIGSTASAYTAYQGTTYPVSWQTESGTIYAGTLDVVSGELTVTMASVTLSSSINWLYSVNTKSYYSENGNEAPGIKREAYASAFVGKSNKFEAFPGGNWADITSGCFVGYVGEDRDGLRFSFAGREVSDVAEKISGTQICYELATPVTYHLTPTKMYSLLGENNLWHDANGNTTAVYRADTTLYIDKKIAAIGG